MYILLKKPLSETTVLLQIEPGTVVNVYNDADMNAVVAAADTNAVVAAAGDVVYDASFAFPNDKLIYKLNVSDTPTIPESVTVTDNAPPADAATNILIAGIQTIGNLMITPTISVSTSSDKNVPTVLGGKKRRYHGKTKKSRRSKR